VDEEEILNSRDVVSLFTNTTVNKASEVIKERLQKDSAWKRTTQLDIDDIIKLLEFVLTTTYFIFRGQIYRQRFGTAMGSQVSPMVADIYMAFLEQTAIATNDNCRLLPVDDVIFCLDMVCDRRFVLLRASDCDCFLVLLVYFGVLFIRLYWLHWL